MPTTKPTEEEKVLDLGIPEELEEFLAGIAERKEAAKKRWEDSADEWWQGETHDNITEVLYAHDPMELSWYAEDEYAPEADAICYRLEEATSISKLAVIIQEVFVEMFSEEMADHVKGVSLGIAKQMWDHIEKGREAAQ